MTEYRSNFRQADRARLMPTLQCPRKTCGAANRPGASHIDLDDTNTVAYCMVCSVSGPIALFQPQEKDRIA